MKLNQNISILRNEPSLVESIEFRSNESNILSYLESELISEETFHPSNKTFLNIQFLIESPLVFHA